MRKPILLLILLLPITGILANTPVKIMGKKAILNESFFESARELYSDNSYPNDKSSFPKDIQSSILDLIGLSNLLNEIGGKDLALTKVLQIQKSDDLAFKNGTIKKGHLNENWIFDSCGSEMVFQVLATSKGKKLEKIVVVQLNSASPVTGERLIQTLSI